MIDTARVCIRSGVCTIVFSQLPAARYFSIFSIVSFTTDVLYCTLLVSQLPLPCAQVRNIMADVLHEMSLEPSPEEALIKQITDHDDL